MLTIEKLKATWLYAVVITAVSAGAITYGVLDVVVVAPIREETIRQAKINNELRDQIESLRKILTRAKDQYDIPDTVVADFSKPNDPSTKSINFENFKIIESDKLTVPVTTVINRNQTTQIFFNLFPITVSTSDVNPDGKTTINVGYVPPRSEVPESLRVELYPAQSMTITSEEGVKLFYVNLLSADPSQKSALIKVVTMSGLRELVP